jgi:hypothetical protein
MNPDVQIDTISIRVPGVDRELGRRLGQMVADSLTPSLRLGPGEAAIDHLHVELTARPAESPESLAARIAEQLCRRIGEAGALEAGR